MSEYKFKTSTTANSFYYNRSGLEIWGGLDEEYLRYYIKTLGNEELKNYIEEAIEYWNQNNFFDIKHASVFLFQDDNNRGVIFVRFNPDTMQFYNQTAQVHISRFMVDRKGDGFGSKMIDWFKQYNKSITLWSNKEAIKFYEKNGFKFQFDKFVEVEGHGKYTWGEWINKK